MNIVYHGCLIKFGAVVTALVIHKHIYYLS